MNYKIIAKFLKYSDFRIPNTNVFLNIAEEIKNYKINIDITSKQIKEKVLEINTSLSLIPKSKSENNIISKVSLSTLIELTDVTTNKEELKEIILIKIPEKVYPELREVFCYFFKKSGFEDIKVDKNIDFKKLYQQKKFQ